MPRKIASSFADFSVVAASTVCGIGFLPGMPGTFGTLPALFLGWFLPDRPLAAAAVALSVLGCVIAASSRRVLGSEDPSAFVLDETAGMALALVFLPRDWRVYLAAFIVFRLLDWKKPWPISRVQAMHHPWSIVLDDLAAGVFTNIAIQIGLKIFLNSSFSFV